jgi:hypothetical protein
VEGAKLFRRWRELFHGLEMKGFVNQCATAKKKGPAEIARPFVDGFVLS